MEQSLRYHMNNDGSARKGAGNKLTLQQFEDINRALSQCSRIEITVTKDGVKVFKVKRSEV